MKDELEQAVARATNNVDYVPAEPTYLVSGYDRELTYQEMKIAFLAGYLINSDQISLLSQCAINNGDPYIAELTAIALSFNDEVSKASVHDSAQHLQNIKKVAEIFDYYLIAGRLDALIQQQRQNASENENKGEKTCER